MLKVWDSNDHRATMDIDLLARISNQQKNLQQAISEIANIPCPEDAIVFETQKLILHNTQTAGEYRGLSCSFSAKLFTTKMPVLIDIGFNDVIISTPQTIEYPTLLKMPKPLLLGYTIETVIAEKMESIVKLALVNTRMKDFYDLWTILKQYPIKMTQLEIAIHKVFKNRGTPISYPIAFTKVFYEQKETKQHWRNFLAAINKEQVDFEQVIREISYHVRKFLTDPTSMHESM